jgi:Homeodomain-like domain
MQATNAKCRVYLADEQRQALEAICREQRVPAAKARRARILLLADEAHPEGHRADWEIAELVGLSQRQVVRIRQKFVWQGVVPTINRKLRAAPPVPPKLDGKAEARLVALCCSTPPEGHQRWTLSLLVDELCRLKVVTSVCRETVRKCLKKISSSPGGASGFAYQNGTGRGSSRTWKRSSTFTAKATTKNIR